MAVPKLRFKEFDGDWTLTTLNQLSTKIGDGIHATPKYDESGTIPFINGNNLVNGRIAINENTKRISSEEFQKYNQILSDRTLFLSINGTIGNLAFYKNEKVLLGKSVCFINLKNDLDKKFIYLLLQSPQLTKTLNSELTGTTIKNLSLATVRNSEFYCPIEAEQTKIASFLSAVDEKITQLTQKHQLLSQYKQGMMQKLFSQQIRFKADDGSEFTEWEQSLLGQHCQITTGKLDANAMKEDGQYRFYTCAKDYYFIDIFAFDTEALLISGNGAHVGYIHYYKGKFNAYQRTYVLDNWKHNIQFVKYFLAKYLKSRIYSEKKEGNTPYIVLATLSEMPFQAPCLEEQTKIANFLSAIDQKIDVVSEQLEQAKLWKKGLLQQMFV